MNAHEGMKVKLNILTELGASLELLKLYCPSIPEKQEGEDIDNPQEFLQYLEERVHEYVKTLYAGANIHARLFYSFMSENDTCPYCAANKDIDTEHDCNNCSFGKVYGKCTDKNSQWAHLDEVLYDLQPIIVNKSYIDAVKNKLDNDLLKELYEFQNC
jgi:hypothetical protein